MNLGKLRAVRIYQCTPRALPAGRLRFVRLGLRAIAPLCEKAQTDEDEVLVNSYHDTNWSRS